MRIKIPDSLSDSLGKGNWKDVAEKKGGPPSLEPEEVYSLEVISTIGTICGMAGKRSPTRPSGDTIGRTGDTGSNVLRQQSQRPRDVALSSKKRAEEPHKTKHRPRGQLPQGLGNPISGAAPGPASPQLWLLLVSLSPCSSPGGGRLCSSTSCCSVCSPLKPQPSRCPLSPLMLCSLAGSEADDRLSLEGRERQGRRVEEDLVLALRT